MNTAGTISVSDSTLTAGAGGAGTEPAISNSGTTPGTVFLYRSIIGTPSIHNFAAWTNRVFGSQLNSAIYAGGGGTFTCIASFNSSWTVLS